MRRKLPWQQERIRLGREWVQSQINRDRRRYLLDLALFELRESGRSGLLQLRKNYGRMYALFEWAARQPEANHKSLKETVAELNLCRRHREEIARLVARSFHPSSRVRR